MRYQSLFHTNGIDHSFVILNKEAVCSTIGRHDNENAKFSQYGHSLLRFCNPLFSLLNSLAKSVIII